MINECDVMLHASHSFFVQSGSIGENAAAFEAKHGGVSGETRRRIKQRAAVFEKRGGEVYRTPRRYGQFPAAFSGNLFIG